MKKWWGILEIHKDADLRAIKRAYAAKLKTIRQDENPAEFMALREAYESAKHYLEHQHVSEDVNIDVAERESSIKYVDGPETQSDKTQSHPQIMDDVHALMKNPWGKNDTASWRAIFDDERLDALDDFADFEHEFLEYLLETQCYYNEEYQLKPIFSADVANFVFTHFGWHENRSNSQALSWLSNRMQASRSKSHNFESHTHETSLDSEVKKHPWAKRFWRLVFRLPLLYILYLFLSKKF